MRKITIIVVFLLCASGCFAQQSRSCEVFDLRRCRETAAEFNHNIRGGEFDLRAAEYQRKEARGEYFPRVDFTALGFYSLHPMLRIGVRDILGYNDFGNYIQELVNLYAPALGLDPTYSALAGGYTARVNLVQPVYAGGRIVTGNRLADLGVEAARLQKCQCP